MEPAKDLNPDLRITSALLYQLSYTGLKNKKYINIETNKNNIFEKKNTQKYKNSKRI